MLVGAFLVCACSPSAKPPTPTDSFDRAALLKNLAENVIYPALSTAAEANGVLSQSISDYCDALGGPDEAAARGRAQDDWKKAMGAWQVAEVMRVGVAADNGGSLRDEIYPWPVVSSCAVDQDVMVRRSNPSGYDVSTRLTNRRGLSALEYLLFAPTLEHSCPNTAAPAGWAGLTAAERTRARCELAAVLSGDIVTRVQTIEVFWDPKQGNFTGTLSVAGTSGSSFARAQDAVNVVSDAMFYIDQMTKDQKLGEPTGVSINRCGNGGEVCLLELESQYAHISKENIENNLSGFRQLFLGNNAADEPGIGFDDFLVSLGADALKDQMTNDIDAALAAVRALPGTLDAAITNDPDTARALHKKVKAICDQLKSQFLTVLGLEIPQAAAGDND